MPYYKATCPDGRDFFTGTVDYAFALKSGERLPAKEPQAHPIVPSSAVYTAADVPTEITGMAWPCRLFEVSGKPVGTDGRHTHGFHTLRVDREIDPWQVFGPQGEAVALMLAQAEILTWDQLFFLGTFWEAQIATKHLGVTQYAMWARFMSEARTTARLYQRDSAFRVAWTATRMAADKSRIRETIARNAAGLGGTEPETQRYLGYAAEVLASAVAARLMEDVMLPTETEWLGRPWQTLIATTG